MSEKSIIPCHYEASWRLLLVLFFLSLTYGTELNPNPPRPIPASCYSDADCPSYHYPYCNLNTNKCDECRNSTDCEHVSGSGTASCVNEGTAYICHVHCSGPSDPICFDMRARCDTSVSPSLCRQCTTDSHCSHYPGNSGCLKIQYGGFLSTFGVCTNCDGWLISETCPFGQSCVNHKCKQCNSHASCSGSTPYCHVAFEGDFCKECLSNMNCTNVSKSKCSSSNTCGPCSSSDDCSHLPDTPVCLNGKCVPCTNDTHCNNLASPYCENNVCVPCSSNNLCINRFPSTKEICANNGTCVNCSSDTHCPSITPFCVNNSCGSACATNNQCSSQSSLTPYCHNDQCVLCKRDLNCPSPTPYCHQNSLCVACTKDFHCLAPTPYCQNYQCFICTNDTHCPTSTPYCIENTCQACTNTSDFCPSLFPSKPICKNNQTCVECMEDSDCPLPNQLCVSETCSEQPPVDLDPEVEQLPMDPDPETEAEQLPGDLDSEEIEQIKQITEAAGTIGSISDSGGLVSSILNPSDPTSMSMGALTKMLQYIKFLNITYPPKLQVMFMHQESNSSFNAKVANKLSESFINRPLPDRFGYYHMKSNFIVNFWQSLVILLAIFGLTMFLIFLSIVTVHHKRVNDLVNKILSAIKWSVFFIIFSGTYGDIMLFSAFEFTTTDFDELYSIISFFICCIINILALLILIKIIMVNLALRRRKNMKVHETEDPMINPEKDFEDYKAVYECYKDKSFDQQIFLALYVLRVSLFNIIISYLYKNPLPQAIFILLLNLAMVVYLIIKKPMKKLINLIQQLTIESLLLVFNVCVLILAFADNANNDSIDTRNNIGEVMAAINIIMPSVSMALIAVKLLLIAKEFYDDYKLSKKVEKLPQFSKPKIRNNGLFIQPLKKFPLSTESSPVQHAKIGELKTSHSSLNHPHNIIKQKTKSRRPKELKQPKNSSTIFLFLFYNNFRTFGKPCTFSIRSIATTSQSV